VETSKLITTDDAFSCFGRLLDAGVYRTPKSSKRLPAFGRAWEKSALFVIGVYPF
jgi:hypothetical protein